jgi:hypothetical protein
MACRRPNHNLAFGDGERGWDPSSYLASLTTSVTWLPMATRTRSCVPAGMFLRLHVDLHEPRLGEHDVRRDRAAARRLRNRLTCDPNMRIVAGFWRFTPTGTADRLVGDGAVVSPTTRMRPRPCVALRMPLRALSVPPPWMRLAARRIAPPASGPSLVPSHSQVSARKSPAETRSEAAERHQHSPVRGVTVTGAGGLGPGQHRQHRHRDDRRA